jgi:hypothetical protein
METVDAKYGAREWQMLGFRAVRRFRSWHPLVGDLAGIARQ